LWVQFTGPEVREDLIGIWFDAPSMTSFTGKERSVMLYIARGKLLGVENMKKSKISGCLLV